MRAYLDNNLVAWPQDNLLKPTFTLRKKDEDGVKAFSFTGDLTFIGTDYDYLYAKLVTDPNALTNEVTLKFEYDCCNPHIFWEFIITAESLKWCENKCELTAAAIEKSVQRDQIICLKNKFIWDNTPTNSFPQGFQAALHPRFTYCNELRPDWLHHIVLILGILVGLLLKVLTPVIAVISAMLTAYNAVVSALNSSVVFSVFGLNEVDFDGDPTTNFFQEYKIFTDVILNFIIGCGRKHPSPLIRDYATNVCEQCGLNFQSSILKNPASQYDKAAYHNAPVHKGVPLTGTSAGVNAADHWIDDNKPLLTGFMFFDQIKGLFNADWTIDANNNLVFERKDHFINLTPWLDLTSLSSDEYEICYEWSKKERPSYGNFHYQKDAVNTVGSEANRRWGDIVEWNPTGSPKQKGEYNPAVQFTTCRFRNDGIDTDVLSVYKGAPFIGTLISGYDNAIIMNAHTCFTPMVLIWDPATGNFDSYVNPTAYHFNNHHHAATNQFHNYPMWFWDHGNLAIYGDPTNADNNLYTNFFYIEDPRLPGSSTLRYEATVEITCARLAAMDLDGMIKSSVGLGKIDEININFDSKLMTIKGEI